MIDCVLTSVDNVDIFTYGDPRLRDLLQFRHEVFIVRQNYNVISYNNMEWDEFDTPASVYVSYTENDRILGCVRLISTEFPYMIEKLWKDDFNITNIIRDKTVWEISRVGIEKNERSISPDKRKNIINNLIAGCYTFAKNNNISSYILLTSPVLLRSLASAGCDIKILSDKKNIGGSFSVVIALVEFPSTFNPIR